MIVGQLMKRNIYTCRPSDSLRRAAEIMSNGECAILPVLDDEGRITGMVTDRDLCMAACRAGSAPESTRVASVASPNVVTVREDDVAEQAEALMRKHRLRRLPVTDRSGRPVGILSVHDLARQAYWAASKGDRLTPESVVTTEIAIGERHVSKRRPPGEP